MTNLIGELSSYLFLGYNCTVALIREWQPTVECATISVANYFVQFIQFAAVTCAALCQDGLQKIWNATSQYVEDRFGGHSSFFISSREVLGACTLLATAMLEIVLKWKLIMSFLLVVLLILWIKKSLIGGKTNTRELGLEVDMLQAFDLAKTAYEPGHTAGVISAMDGNIDINKPMPPNRLTLFLCACLSGERRLVKYLLGKGADISISTCEGDTPLYLATFGVLNSPRKEVALLGDLITAGCDVNAQNRRGYTALHRAASQGNTEVIKCLLKHGADPYVTNASGIYPIDSAVNAGHIDAASLLQITLEDDNVWDIVDPHTPTRIRLGLQSPLKKHLLESALPTQLQRSKRQFFRDPEP